MNNIYIQIKNFILNNNNDKLINLLVKNYDKKIFELYRGCLIHIALSSGNIEAAKIISKASIGKFDNL